jgi:endonuclease YncB( thermonuclease family)
VDVDLGFVGPSRPANDHDFVKIVDGDTPRVTMDIRMVSIDTPETRFENLTPVSAQAKLERAKARLQDGTYDALPEPLREYLTSRITPDAAQRHIDAGLKATDVHEQKVDERLTLPDGTKRKMAVISTGALLDDNGRLLAYTAPWFGGGPSDPLPARDDPRRRTFNLDMVASGWAALFVIYPSIPRRSDLNLLLSEADKAWIGQLGAWHEFGQDLLLAYEYRACIKLGVKDLQDPAKAIAEAYQRVCVDLRTMTEVGLYGYHAVPPQHRLWIWASDLEQARTDLPLVR